MRKAGLIGGVAAIVLLGFLAGRLIAQCGGGGGGGGGGTPCGVCLNPNATNFFAPGSNAEWHVENECWCERGPNGWIPHAEYCRTETCSRCGSTPPGVVKNCMGVDAAKARDTSICFVQSSS